MNSVNLMARLVRDAEVEEHGDYTLTKMRVVYNKWNKKKKEEEPKFFSVKTWKSLPLKKGQLVVIDGELDEFTFEADGKKNSFVYITGFRVVPVNIVKQESRAEQVEKVFNKDFEDEIPF